MTTEFNDQDVKGTKVLRNGILTAIFLVLLSMTTCRVASWHYEYLDKQLDQTRYLATRPW